MPENCSTARFNLGPKTMAIKKVMRRIDLGFQFVIALEKQLAGELLAIVSLLKRAMQRQRIKREPDLRRVAVDFVN